MSEIVKVRYRAAEITYSEVSSPKIDQVLMDQPKIPLKIEANRTPNGLMGNRTFHANLFNQDKRVKRAMQSR